MKFVQASFIVYRSTYKIYSAYNLKFLNNFHEKISSGTLNGLGSIMPFEAFDLEVTFVLFFVCLEEYTNSYFEVFNKQTIQIKQNCFKFYCEGFD